MAFTGQLGGAESYLSNLVLGTYAQSDPFTQVVAQSLTIAQAIELNAKVVSATSVLTNTQTIGRSYVPARTVSQTLTLTQAIKTLKYVSADSTLTLSQTVAFDKSKLASASGTLALTYTIATNKNFQRLIVQGLINLRHTVARNVVLNLSVSQTQALSQNVVGYAVKTVTSTLALSQTVTFQKYKHIISQTDFGQALTLQISVARHYYELLQTTQQIARNIKSNLTVAQSAALTSTIVAYRVNAVQQAAPFTQTIEAYAAKAVKNQLTLAQSISVTHFATADIQQTVNLVQDIFLQRSRSFSVSHVNSMDQTIRRQKVLSESLTSALSMSQLIRFSTYVRSISQSLGTTQTVAYTPVYKRSVNQALVFGQTIGLQKAYAREVVSTLVYPQTRSIYLGLGNLDTVVLDNIQYSLLTGDNVDVNFQAILNVNGSTFYTRRRRPYNKKYCVLSSPNGAITLPQPEFGDSEANTGIIELKKSMNNVTYTYVKNLRLRVLKLNFQLMKAKAWELRDFLISNSATNSNKLIDLYTWKGEKWKVFVQSNPLELVVAGRYSPTNEKVNVALEFEGFKVM
jgi:hypothetical protein